MTDAKHISLDLSSVDLILFDLDGTISNPLEGIGNSINHALTQLGYKTLPMAELSQYVGPPLDKSFEHITSNPAQTAELVQHYRQRYGSVGYTENTLYPNIRNILNKLSAAKIPMAICTSKRCDFAEKILARFELRQHFQFISGGEVGIHKHQQIAELLSAGKVTTSALMIGDRASDIIAAHKNGLAAGGVLWGFGSHTEPLKESPEYLFKQVTDLERLITF